MFTFIITANERYNITILQKEYFLGLNIIK